MEALQIDVVCAIIEDHGKLLVAQRSPAMPLPLKWEFPGGKVKPGESDENSIVREIKEELDVDIVVIERLKTSSHFDGNRVINLIPFICKITFGEPKALEHQQLSWCNKDECGRLDWCPADIPIINGYWQLEK